MGLGSGLFVFTSHSLIWVYLSGRKAERVRLWGRLWDEVGSGNHSVLVYFTTERGCTHRALFTSVKVAPRQPSSTLPALAQCLPRSSPPDLSGIECPHIPPLLSSIPRKSAPLQLNLLSTSHSPHQCLKSLSLPFHQPSTPVIAKVRRKQSPVGWTIGGNSCMA